MKEDPDKEQAWKDHLHNKLFPFMVKARAYVDIVQAREKAGEKKEDIWADLEAKGITI